MINMKRNKAQVIGLGLGLGLVEFPVAKATGDSSFTFLNSTHMRQISNAIFSSFFIIWAPGEIETNLSISLSGTSYSLLLYKILI